MRIARPGFAAALMLALLGAWQQEAGAQERPNSTGSGFLVGPTLVLTNHHVIAGCGRLEVRNERKQQARAKLVADDPRRDLALLSVPAGAGVPLVFRDGPPVERGEQVVTYGFPLAGLLSSGPTLTTGDVSALSGIRDNPLHLQISAPVQPGNSGGPLLDRNGHVIGVVVSKLNALRVARMTGGDVPQNVNFAIKGSEAVAFLREQNAAPKLAASDAPELRPAQVGEIANAGTLFVQCFEGAAVADLGAQGRPAPGGTPGGTPGGGSQSSAAPSQGSAAPGTDIGSARKPADDPSFRLVNRGPQGIEAVFASQPGTGGWGQNRLDGDVLDSGAARVFRLPRGSCVYDLKVVFTDRRARERRGVNLCNVADLPVS
jgi:hypothetical protein